MKSFLIALSVLWSSSLLADVVEGFNPLETCELTPNMSLSFYMKEGSDLLFWRLKQFDSKVSSTLEPGSGIGPGQPYVFEWNKETETFCFATPETIRTYRFPKPGSTEGTTNPPMALHHIQGLSDGFVAAVERMLKKVEEDKANP